MGENLENRAFKRSVPAGYALIFAPPDKEAYASTEIDSGRLVLQWRLVVVGVATWLFWTDRSRRPVVWSEPGLPVLPAEPVANGREAADVHAIQETGAAAGRLLSRGLEAGALNRDATLRQAERLLRQGRLDQAISEYQKIIQDQPLDWSTINTVGDLFVRAGQVETGSEHFTRIANHLFDEGMLPLAVGVYKKILRLKPHDEHAGLRCAEIAERQGLLADAKAALVDVAEGRLRRGDTIGAAQIDARLASMPSR